MPPARSTSRPEDAARLALKEPQQRKTEAVQPHIFIPLNIPDCIGSQRPAVASRIPDGVTNLGIGGQWVYPAKYVYDAMQSTDSGYADGHVEELDIPGFPRCIVDPAIGRPHYPVDIGMHMRFGMDANSQFHSHLPPRDSNMLTELDSLAKAARSDAQTESVVQTKFMEAGSTATIAGNNLSIPGHFSKREKADSCRRTTGTPTSHSSSGSAMTQLSGTTDSAIAANMMSTVGAQDVYDKLLDFFSRFIEFKLHITESQQRGGPLSKRNSRAQQNLTVIKGGSQRQAAKDKRKRVSQADDSFDDSGEAPDDEEPDGKRRKTERLKIACPYMKRYPTEFCSWRTCVGPGFDGMNRMKEHLKRRHFKENGCHRCGLYLESNQALQDHLRSLDICPVKVILPQMGFMTQIQSEEISKKRQAHTVPLLQRWKEIYLILFPDADEDTIPGPYFEATEISDGLSNIFDPQEYESFLKRHLPARILMNLNREFQIISDLAKAKLAEMLQEESLEVLKAYVLQKGGSSSQTLQTDCSGSELLDPAAIDNSLFDNIEAIGDQGQDAFDFSFLEAYCQQADKEGSEQTDSAYGPSVM